MSQNVVLACPSCATQFSAPVGHFLPDGRQVRCSKCQHVWFHAAPSRNRIDPSKKAMHMAPVREAIVSGTSVQGDSVQQDSVREASGSHDAPVQDDVIRDAPVQDNIVRDAPTQDTSVQDDIVRDAPTQDTSIQDDIARDAALRRQAVHPPATADAQVESRVPKAAALRPKARPARNTDPDPDPLDPPRRKRVSWWAGGFWSWLLWLIALLLLLAILAYVFRDPLRAAVPQAAPQLNRYTSAVDKTAQGLTGRTAVRDPFQFENIHYDIKEYDGEKTILVEADLVNTGPDDMPAPKVRVRVVDGDRAPLHASVIAPEDMSESIAAGASTRYFVRIPEAPADFEAVLLNVEKE